MAEDLNERKESLESTREPLSEGFVEKEIKEKKENVWGYRKAQIEQDQQKMQPGFSPFEVGNLSTNPTPMPFGETFNAVFRQSVLGQAAFGVRFDEQDADPNYKTFVNAPPDLVQRYPHLYLAVKNDEKEAELTENLRRIESDRAIMSARPGASFFANLVTPESILLGVGTYGLGRAALLPLMQKGAFPLLNTSRKLEVFAEEVILGGTTAASSIVAEEYLKKGFNDAYEIEDLGQQVFFGALSGMALGSVFGGYKGYLTKELPKNITENYRVNSETTPIYESSTAPEGQPSAPTEPTRTPPPTASERRDLGLRMQQQQNPQPKPKSKRNLMPPDEIDRWARETSLPERTEGFEALRERFKVLGENFMEGEGVPDLAKRAIQLVKAPWRNYASTNRLISSPYGMARLYATSLARNGIEFIGTREGIVLPRNAQNIIEDMMGINGEMQVNYYEHFLRYMDIDPKSKFAAEQLTFAGVRDKMREFYRAVGSDVLTLGTSLEVPGVNPHIRAAAKDAVEHIYKPIGDELVARGLVETGDEAKKILNYLNRIANEEEIFNNPDDFIDWSMGELNKANRAIKSIMPNYKARKDVARPVKRASNRWFNAFNESEQLRPKVQKNEPKVLEEEKARNDKLSSIEKEYADKVQKVEEKYKNLADKETAEVPDISTTKKLLREEVKDARKERDALTKEFDDAIKKLQTQIKDTRTLRDKEIDAIKSGKRDSIIKSEYREANLQELAEANIDLTDPNVMESVRLLDEEVVGEVLNELRNDLIDIKRAEARFKIDALQASVASERANKKQLLQTSAKELDKNITEASNLLQEESKVSGKVSKQSQIKVLLDSRKRMEVKYLDLKKSKEISRVNAKAQQKIAKLNEPINKLDYLERRYSRDGLIAQAQYDQMKMMARRLPPEQAKKTLKSARKVYDEQIENARKSNDIAEIAQELAEDYKRLDKEAEDMIPWDLRNEKTGKPYNTWEDGDLDTPRGIADQIMWRYLGEKDQFQMNPIAQALGGSRPKITKGRSFKFSDDAPGAERWFERDITITSNAFMSAAAPMIALDRVMRELNKLPMVRDTVKRLQVLDKKIGPEKALEMSDLMQNYNEIPKVLGSMLLDEFQILSEGKSVAERAELKKQYNKAKGEMDTLWKQIQGIYGQGFNIYDKTAMEMVSLVNSWSSTVINNNLGLSMIGDAAGGIFQFGLEKWARNLSKLAASGELRDLGKRQLKALYVTGRMVAGTVIKDRVSGQHNSLRNTPAGKFVSNFANRMGNLTGANAVEDLNILQSWLLITDSILEIANKASKGQLTTKEIAFLAQNGISEKDIRNIHELWKKYGTIIDEVYVIDPAKLNNLTQEEWQAWNKFSEGSKDVLRKTNPRPGVGSLPNLYYEPLGRSIMFLKSWYGAATNDLFVPAMQRADKEAAQGFLTLLAIGALQSEVRKLYRDTDKDEDKPFNMEGFLFEALSNSAAGGIYTWPIDLAITAGIIAGEGGARYDPSNGLSSFIMGPGLIGTTERALKIMGRLSKILRDEDRQFNYKDFNYMASTAVPFYRWAPVAAIAKPYIKEGFDQRGRLE